MSTASAIRFEIERTLENRFPGALTPERHTSCDVVTTGIAEVDALLHGGLPVGAISELIGPVSSGKTSLALSFLAQRTTDGQVCAWVDANDSFDPASAAACGVHLPQILWVRCQDSNRTWKRKPWTRLDQALRATDLLLQAGGFGVIVLDLGATRIEHACRIPLATWFRFRQSAYRARTSLVVLGQEANAQSSAEVVLRCSTLRAIAEGEKVLNGMMFEAGRKRLRLPTVSNGKKMPPASTWSAQAAWEGKQRA